jgi:hypothetical protein
MPHEQKVTKSTQQPQINSRRQVPYCRSLENIRQLPFQSDFNRLKQLNPFSAEAIVTMKN